MGKLMKNESVTIASQASKKSLDNKKGNISADMISRINKNERNKIPSNL